MNVKIGKLDYTNGDDTFLLENLEITLDLQMMTELQKSGVQALKDIMSTTPKTVVKKTQVSKNKNNNINSKVITQEELDAAMKVVLQKKYPDKDIDVDRLHYTTYNRYKHRAYCRAWNKKYSK